MPVVQCPDCGQEVSTIATVCPHCGRPGPAASAAALPMQPIQPLVAGQSAAPVAEETLWKGTPSTRVLAWRTVVMILTAIVVFVLARMIAGNSSDLEQSSRIIQVGWWVMALIAVLQLIAILVAWIRIRSTMYTITNQRILIERGILSKRLSEIDLRTIDDTQFFQSIGQRILGIGNVTLDASDKEAPSFVLRDLPDPRSLRETIRSHVYRVSQRQFYMRQA